MNIGDTWNESELRSDEITGRPVRRLSSTGRINQTPTYHTNSGFTADGRFLVFASVRDGTTWIIRAEVETGNLKALWRAPGVGDRNYIHRCMALDFDDVDGGGISGNRVCIAPRSGLAVFTCERRLIALDIESCEERVLLDDCGEEWIFGAPCVSPDERSAIITLSSAHPQALAGKMITEHYKSYHDHQLRILRVPMNRDASGEAEVLYEHAPAQSAHCAFCPTDGNLLYFDLDLPPHYWGGGDGHATRVWLLDLTTREVRPLKKSYPAHFQTHTAWLWDGSALAYHGSMGEDRGVYIGITRPNGETVWEHVFADATFYGHLTPDAKHPALILDGDFSRDLLQWLYYDEDAPRLEPICRHGTEWRSIPGQYSHPHPLTDASGRWISFTSARGGRSDVFVVDTK